jgi:hypothetical protein
LTEHRLPGARRNSDNPLSYEIKSAKEGSGAEMAGSAKVYEKLHEGLAELSKLPGKLVDTRLPVAAALPVQQARAALGQCKKDRLECGTETLGFLLGINAGACGPYER